MVPVFELVIYSVSLFDLGSNKVNSIAKFWIDLTHSLFVHNLIV